jgi:putative FmdB family regulatory protein
MAIYTYRCEACGHEDDLQIPMSQDKSDPVYCTECQALTMRRVFTPVDHRHVNAKGETVRAPGSEWVGGEQFDRKRFLAENPGARRGKR